MKRKLIRLYIGSFLASFLPLAVFIGVRWNFYVKSVPAGSIRLTVGGLVVSAVLAAKVTGKLKLPSVMFTCLLLAVLCWFLQPILQDLGLVFTMAAVGEAIDYIFFRTAIRKTKDAMHADDMADRIAKKIGGISS